MGSRVNHDEVEELLGAYALDALDADEVGLVDAHLQTCPRCRDEVQRHRETAAFLAQSGGAAPEGLWQRIASELVEAPPMVAPVVPLGAREARRRTQATASESARSQRGRFVTVVSAVAAVAAVISLVLAVKVVEQERHLRALDAALVVDGMQQVANAALLHPDGRKVDLRSGDGTQWATAVVLPNGQGYIVEDELSALEPARTYQLWGMVDGRTVSLGVLGNDPDVVTFTVAPNTTLLALTTEQAGGVVETRNPPIATGVVPT